MRVPSKGSGRFRSSKQGFQVKVPASSEVPRRVPSKEGFQVKVEGFQVKVPAASEVPSMQVLMFQEGFHRGFVQVYEVSSIRVLRVPSIKVSAGSEVPRKGSK